MLIYTENGFRSFPQEHIVNTPTVAPEVRRLHNAWVDQRNGSIKRWNDTVTWVQEKFGRMLDCTTKPFLERI